MNRYCIPTLQHIATVKIAGILCNDSGIRISILCSQTAFLETGNKIWKDVSQKALEFFDIQELPEHLKREIVNVIKPMGTQMQRFIFNAKHNLRIFDHSFHEFIKYFYWTSLGILNEKEIMADLLRCEHLSLHFRYELACLYCFEDQIHNLWYQMSEQYRFFYNSSDLQDPNLIIFWSYYITGKTKELIADPENLWKYGLNAAISKRNDTAIRYFWEKINTNNREMCLHDIIPKLHSQISTLNFLFSKLNDKILRDILQEYFKNNEYSNMLLNLLDFPYQYNFMHIVKYYWNILPEEHFDILLKRLTEKTCDSKDYNYFELLREFGSQILMKNKR